MPRVCFPNSKTSGHSSFTALKTKVHLYCLRIDWGLKHSATVAWEGYVASSGLTRSQLWNCAENQKREHHHRNKAELFSLTGLQEKENLEDWKWPGADGRASQDEPNLGGEAQRVAKDREQWRELSMALSPKMQLDSAFSCHPVCNPAFLWKIWDTKDILQLLTLQLLNDWQTWQNDPGHHISRVIIQLIVIWFKIILW